MAEFALFTTANVLKKKQNHDDIEASGGFMIVRVNLMLAASTLAEPFSL